MTRKEAIKYAVEWLKDEYLDVKDRAFIKIALEALEQEPCEDAISRKSLKHKLEEQHDFFVNAYGGFSNLPPNDKSRVDEITNCIAMVVNEPPVNPQPKTGHWIEDEYEMEVRCSACGEENDKYSKYCPDCGCRMVEPQESEDEE